MWIKNPEMPAAGHVSGDAGGSIWESSERGDGFPKRKGGSNHPQIQTIDMFCKKIQRITFEHGGRMTIPELIFLDKLDMNCKTGD